MKIKFDIECSPEEARKFLGLPDVLPMQEKMMQEVEEKMLESMRTMDAETIMKTWMPATIQNWGEMQKMFWGQMGMQNSSEADKSDTADEKDAK